MHVVAGEEIDAIKGVTGNEALDFVERSERIEGAEPGFEPVGLKPDGVTVGLAGLHAARLAEIAGGAAFSERNERANIDAHASSEPNDDFKVRFDACAIGCLADDLDVAECVGHSAGFFVEAGSGKNDIGERRGLGKEKILHDEECVLENRGIEPGMRNRICADHKKRAKIASGCSAEHLRE